MKKIDKPDQMEKSSGESQQQHVNSEHIVCNEELFETELRTIVNDTVRENE